MHSLEFLFPVSGVKINVLWPPLVMFIISFFTSMGGVSGAFLLMPFQMTVLGYSAPSSSGTNHVYNLLATPSGAYRYMREGRMFWPLVMFIAIGTLPGVFLGYWLRVRYMPDAGRFGLFVGAVLLYIGGRLLLDQIIKKKPSAVKTAVSCAGFGDLKTTNISFKRVEFIFMGCGHGFNAWAMTLTALTVGIIGGAYGIGGGAIIAPLCISAFGLPAYIVAGPALLGTFLTSAVAVVFYSISPVSSPDWMLGLLFGLGGFFGTYLGARTQKHIPERAIKLILGVVITAIAVMLLV